METNIKGSLKIIDTMGKEGIVGVMDHIMMDTFFKDIGKDMENGDHYLRVGIVMLDNT